MGCVMSAASIIFQAADERIMSPYSTMMIHYGSESISDVSKNVLSNAEESKRINRIMEDIYLDKIKQVKPRFSRSQLEKLLNFDTYIAASRAVEMGLADTINTGH